MNITTSAKWLILMLLGLGLSGCVGVKAFTNAARSGETVALPIGWQKTISRQDMSVTFTPASNPSSPVTYSPGDARVRSVFNLYPDPASKLVVGTKTGQSLGVDATVFGGRVNGLMTGNESDWWQTMLMLDLPTLPVGNATIKISDTKGTVIPDISIEILAGTSSKNLFPVYFPGGDGQLYTVNLNQLNSQHMLPSLERADRATVTFTGSVIPHAVELEFTHDVNVGKTWVVNPRGDIKSVIWSDTGTTIKVMVSPTTGQTLSQFTDLKFYIAGGLGNLMYKPNSLKAYDISGNLINGITPSIQ